MLDPRDAQSGHAAAVDRPLPAGKFLEGQPIAFARFVDGQEPAVDGRDDLRLAAHDPAGRRRRRQRVQRKRLAQGADDLCGAAFMILAHSLSIFSTWDGGVSDSSWYKSEGFNICDNTLVNRMYI